MKTIGLIGGMSWEGTATYYRIINETVQKELGGYNSAKIILNSVNFAEIETCRSQGDWDKAGQIISEAAVSLEKAGADFILIASNTMHKVVPMIQPHISLPILHIAKATLMTLKEKNIKKVGLMATKYTLTHDFYKNILTDGGIEVLIPREEEIELANNIIYKELCLGKIKDASRGIYQRIIDGLDMAGAQGIIFGCAEIGLLISQKYVRLPVFDSTVIHATIAAKEAMKD
ncbi:aspartate/glutamate racemase family protein [Succinivibrio dextrinosolvens]|uniref:aspartate/glutamate racemase family protein n=1 Tax=Succinivibrio dextrinosolvens TaxID=83771 RepID=UPI001924452F|nr:aspartate/glutamate racemase family protein [Succinivibrio dextrinosolvens]